MGRQKKFEDSKSRSFLLPLGLFNQIATVAQQRGRDVSDVVREILEENIRDYSREADLVLVERLQDALDAVHADPLVCEFFDRYKNEENPMLPLRSDLDDRQLLTLRTGLNAYHTLKREEKVRPNDIKAIEAFKELRDEMVFDPEYGEISRHVRRLSALVASRDHVRIIQESGHTIVEVLEELGEVIDEEEADLWALRSLQIVIRKKMLCRDDDRRGRAGFRSYKAPEPSNIVDGGDL
jgi:hypothetical protein